MTRETLLSTALSLHSCSVTGKKSAEHTCTIMSNLVPAYTWSPYSPAWFNSTKAAIKPLRDHELPTITARNIKAITHS